MKKLLLFALLCAMFMGVTSCNSCKKNETNVEAKVDTTLVVENIISTDREAMTLQYDSAYRWYETCITVKDFFDSDSVGEPVVMGVSNIFQYVVEKDSTCADVQVVLYTHVKDTCVVEARPGFWVGDMILNNEEIKLTFVDAYNKMMQANCIKPHSRQCVLRKELGPTLGVNPQYIFGNVQRQVYVDAVTGAVTDKNPVFPKTFKMPLGEWP